MDPINTAHTTFTTLLPVLETALRRRLQIELSEIREQINQFQSNDSLSQLISTWHQSFLNAMQTNGDLEEIKRTYIQLLQELLVDSCTNTPLDNQAYLGTDGATYGHASFCVCLSQLPPQFRNRSLLHLEDPNPITIRPHQLVRYMLQWLHSHNEMPQPPEPIRSLYQQLEQQNQLPQLPLQRAAQSEQANDRRARFEAIRARIQQRERTQLAANSPLIQTLTNQLQTVTERMNAAFSVVREESSANMQRNNQALDQAQQMLEERVSLLEQEEQQLAAENADLQQRIEELERQLAINRNEITETELAARRLQQSINELRQAMAKQKKGAFKSVLKTIAIAACVVFSTWGASMLLGGSGFSMTFMPTQGGAKAIFGLAI